jgi:hypothetical protein
VVVEVPAVAISAGGIPAFPPLLTVGDRDIVAMTGWIHHPGEQGTARIRLDSLAVSCWNEERALLPAGENLDRIRLLWDGDELSTVTDLSASRQPVLMPLPGLTLEPGDSAAVVFVVDIEASAPSPYLMLTIPAVDVFAFDANSGQPVAVNVESSSEDPFFSGLARLGLPPRELIVDLESMMPAALAADGRETVVAVLSLTNPAVEGSGSIRVEHLVARAADQDESSVDIGAAVERVGAYVDDSLWAESESLAKDAATALIELPEALVVDPGRTARVEVRVGFRVDAALPGLRLGWDADDIGIVQPSGALMTIEARPAEGEAFPLWTEIGNFGATSLKESFANFPNPFAAGAEETSFVFFLPTEGTVSLTIWTARGERVLGITEDDHRPAGLHQDLRWHGRNGRGSTVINGVYVAELTVRFNDGSSERLLHKVAVVR